MTYSPDLAARALPERPNLEHLKNEAKRRLEAARLTDPRVKLTDIQFRLAREYGFSSWRELKAGIEALNPKPTAMDPLGDWVGMVSGNRFALHVHMSAGGGYWATSDVPEAGEYGLRTDDVQLEGDRLSFSHKDIGVLYEGRWDGTAAGWAGEWRQNGLTLPVTLTRGVIPPYPVLLGMDGLWDGILDGQEGEKRLTFRIRTDEHGTFGKLFSPDSAIHVASLKALRREGQTLTFEMRSFVVTGALSADGEVIDGVFRKGDWTGPLVLTRRAPGAAPPQKRQPAAIDLPLEALARFVGVYGFSQGRTLTVQLQGDRLMTDSDGDFSLCVTPVSETEFRYAMGDSALIFQRDDEGQVTGVLRRLEGWAETGQKLG